ncbi:MAG: hypothetical protein QNJ60_16925 [Xenococcaceae cyanobacterium MO_188.B19]|nr:hypothetical protein [Xenococcaceae cyanobacterium MO_188.B19]
MYNLRKQALRDRIFGQNGNDILNVDSGSDFLVGGKDNDFIDGGEGDDTLIDN